MTGNLPKVDSLPCLFFFACCCLARRGQTLQVAVPVGVQPGQAFVVNAPPSAPPAAAHQAQGQARANQMGAKAP
jgi:hypothetical protein